MNPWQALLDVIGGVLNFFYQIIPNLGIAIILLTLAISLLLFPLTLKQTRSMKAMQEIQPQVKALQKELKGDREELNKQLMELYKEKGVNPAAGCLPLIVQMPIWFALFSVLRNPNDYIDTGGDELNATFLGMDLTKSPSDVVPDLITSGDILAAIPYLLLIVLIVAAGFYQQRQMTARRTDDGSQQQGAAQSMQTAMKIMPLFFGFISWTLSSGLGIYFATSNLFRIGQQALIFRMDENKGDGGGKQPAERDKSPDEGDAGTSSPSPHASKKRNRRRRK